MTRCRILLTPLTHEEEIATGYSRKGLKHLAGKMHTSPALRFTRQQFMHDLPQAQKGMSISGYQPKIQLVLEEQEFTVVDHQGLYILKPSPIEFPHLAENEHATMTLMARLGFAVPPHGLLRFKPEQADDEPEFAFVIKRFDRDEKTGHPIHQEQLDGAMGIGEKFGKTHTDGRQYVSYERLALFLSKHVNDNIVFKIDLFRRIAYAYMLGNNDMHLRNFGLMHLRSGQLMLAPIYDFVSVAPYPTYFSSCFMALPLLIQEEGDEALAPGFETAYGEYLGMDFILFGQRIGLSENLTKKLLADFLKEAKCVESTYRDSFMPADAIETTLRCYRHRLNLMSILDAERI
ncbi:type II toxin-antitoxin system HipA family toxin [Pectobacterium sp. CHL-2024]|uniref:type II toxin-antitoxin system HipA family toxin n=1 Tax=Pectobacterium sp. CHL-2024 TaxID=3377079 RepID=UPI003811F5B6